MSNAWHAAASALTRFSFYKGTGKPKVLDLSRPSKTQFNPNNIRNKIKSQIKNKNRSISL